MLESWAAPPGVRGCRRAAQRLVEGWQRCAGRWVGVWKSKCRRWCPRCGWPGAGRARRHCGWSWGGSVAGARWTTGSVGDNAASEYESHFSMLIGVPLQHVNRSSTSPPGHIFPNVSFLIYFMVVFVYDYIMKHTWGNRGRSSLDFLMQSATSLFMALGQLL